jgi:hypothetical protein
MATSDEDRIGSFAEGFHDELGVETSGTHNSNDPDVRLIGVPGDTGEVGGGVGAPVAEESNDAGLPGGI